MSFQTERDVEWQRAVGRRLAEVRPGSILHAFAPLDEIDGWVEREQRMVSIVEIKRRYNQFSRYPTVWFSMRKWQSLMLVCNGHGVPGMFIVHYDDRISWIAPSEAAGLPIIIGKREDRGAPNDTEPVIDVPTTLLHTL